MSEIISPCFLSQVKPKDIDKELTPERVGALWNYFKAKYVDKGIGYGDAMDAMSQELGIPRSLIARALAKPKALRPQLMSYYMKNRARMQALNQARLEATYINTPGLPRGVQWISDGYRGLKTLWHGPVFPFTHAIDVAKMPTRFGEFFKTELNSFKYLSKNEHLQAMEALRDDPAYSWGLRAGLVVDPARAPIGILAKRGGTWASRAWDALKVMRLNLFKSELFTDTGEWKPKYADLSDKEKLEVAKEVASRWNHLTGAVSPREGNLGALSNVMFAPELTAAKWHALISDHKKAAAILSKKAQMMPLTAAERKFVGMIARQDGELIAGRVAQLAINYGMLQAGVLTLPGQEKQELNFTHPERSDWLRPKAFGQVFNMRGQDEIVQLLGKLHAVANLTPRELKRKRDTKMGIRAKKIGQYAMGKLSPAYEKATELTTGEDFMGNPLPFSSNPGSRYHPAKDAGEYVAESVTPIFMEGAIHEFYQGMRDAGLDGRSANDIMRGLSNPSIMSHALLTGGEEFVGLGVYDENH